MLKPHTPVSTSTIFPLSDPAVKAAQPSRFRPLPSPYWIGAWMALARGADQGWNTAW